MVIEPIISNETVTSIAVDLQTENGWHKKAGVLSILPMVANKLCALMRKTARYFQTQLIILILIKKVEVLPAPTKVSFPIWAKLQKDRGITLLFWFIPTPVKEDYFESIAIKNVIENSDVKITDIALKPIIKADPHMVVTSGMETTTGREQAQEYI